MSDMGDYFRDVRSAKQQRHAKNKEQNIVALANAGLQFTIANNGETLCFREEGMPKVDFFPSSGRWYVPPEKLGKKGSTFNGGAHGFIGWYTKRLNKVKALQTVKKVSEQHG